MAGGYGGGGGGGGGGYGGGIGAPGGTGGGWGREALLEVKVRLALLARRLTTSTEAVGERTVAAEAEQDSEQVASFALESWLW